MIELKNIQFKYGDNFKLINIDLNILKNDKVVIYYRSGGGATTLAKIICGLVSPTNGTVLIERENYNLKSNKISLLLKNPLFLNKKSAFYNLKFAFLTKQIYFDELEIKRVLKIFNINYKTKPCNMDKNQKILLAFARAYLLKKEIMIIDDIFYGLDSNQIKELLPYFYLLINNKTVVFFDSTYTIFDSFKRKSLVWGSLYDVNDKAIVLSAYLLHFSNYKCVKATLIRFCENKAYFKSDTNDLFKVDFYKSQENICDYIEDVFLVFNTKNKLVAIFDAMDEKKIWSNKKAV